jgi:broad specificity phosphatase PhoE
MLHRIRRSFGRIRFAAWAVAIGLLIAGLHWDSARAQPDLWALLRGGGQIVLMRHGLTDPVASEPPGARVGDCATQRNLGEPGREEARRVGAAFRAHGIPIGKVLSSRWCRCLETARLAFGTVEPWPDLEFAGFSDSPEKRRRDRAIRTVLGKAPEQGNTVLVSHGFVIEPLTGISPATAEFMVLTPQAGGGFTVAGHLRPSDL